MAANGALKRLLTIEEVLYSVEDCSFYRGAEIDDADTRYIIEVTENALTPNHSISESIVLGIEGVTFIPVKVKRLNNETLSFYSTNTFQPLCAVAATLTLTEKILIAINLSEALIDIHKANLIHTRISSRTVWVDANLSVKITGLEYGTGYPINIDTPPQDTSLENLSYCAPELSGRTSIYIDYRADCYSVGVLLYNLITGNQLFSECTNAVDLFHQKQTRHSPHINKYVSIPSQLDAIVHTLLHPDPTNRYPNAVLLHHDLYRCYRDLVFSGDISNFPLSEKLSLNHSLHTGNYNALHEISECFKIANHERGWLVVSGESGVGKSAALIEALKRLPRHILLFIQYEPSIDIAYVKFADRLKIMLTSEHFLLLEKDKDLTESTAVLQALLDKTELDRPRIFETFTKWLSLVTVHLPVVIFIEDIQWSDSVNMRFTASLLNDVRIKRLFVMCSLRNEEANNSKIAELTEQIGFPPLASYYLAPLSTAVIKEHFQRVLLTNDGDACEHLADFAFDHTGGLPLYINDLLHTLWCNSSIIFIPITMCFKIDNDKVDNTSLSKNDNFLVDCIHSLEQDPKSVAALAACVQGSFSSDLLALISELPKEKVIASIETLVRLGIFTPIGEEYRFVHDYAQQAAYSLNKQYDPEEYHELLGSRLLRHQNDWPSPDCIFTVAHNLNTSITSPPIYDKKFRKVISVNLQAGDLSTERGGDGFIYYENAYRFLPSDIWDEDPRLALDVLKKYAHSALLFNRDKIVVDVTTQALEHLSTPLEQFPFITILIKLYSRRDENDKIISTAINFLEKINIRFSIESKSNLQNSLRLHWLRLLITKAKARKRGSHPTTQSIIASELLPKLIVLNLNINPTIALWASINLIKQQSVSDVHINLCELTFYTLKMQTEIGSAIARDFHEYAKAENPHSDLPGLTHIFLAPYFEPANSTVLSMAHFIATSSRQRSHQYYPFYTICLLSSGQPFRTISQSIHSVETSSHFLSSVRASAAYPQAFSHFLQIMGTEENSKDRLFSPVFDFGAAESDRYFILYKSLLEVISAYTHRQFDDAYTIFSERLHDFTILPVTELKLLFFYYSARTFCKILKADPSQSQQHSISLSICRRMIKSVAHTPNYAHRHALIEGEIALLAGNLSEAFKLYTEALKLAKEHNSLADIGFINEEIAELSKDAALESSIIYCYKDAARYFNLVGYRYRAAYCRNQVEKLTNDVATNPVSDARHANFDAVQKASVIIASERNKDRLLERLLSHVLMIGGAEHAILLLRENNVWTFVADADVKSREIHKSDLPTYIEHYAPVSVINDAIRLQAPIVLDNASTSTNNAYRNDLYINKHVILSLLCLPIVKQSHISGVLVLTNNQMESAFHTERIQDLLVLASHTAIAIENVSNYDLLEKKVAQRTLEANEAADKERQANQAKDRFIASISHEIKNPLSAILTYASLIQREQDIDICHQHANVMATCGDHLESVIEGVLDAAKIEAGTFDLKPTVFTLEDIVDFLKTQSKLKRNNNVVTDFGDPTIFTGKIFADRYRLQQVLVNLIGNALKFTTEGFVKLGYKVSQSSSESVTIEFSVTDSGTGISKDDCKAIFKAFSKADSNSAQNRGGAGLGLAISKEIVEKIGGELAVESEIGKGSRFFFTAKFDLASEEQVVTLDSPGKFEAINQLLLDSKAILATKSIMVVDDSEPNVASFGLILKPYGVTVLPAYHGREAVSLIQSGKHKVDLIILDLQMPEMDGYATMMALHNEKFQNPIIISSATNSVEERKRCRDLGASNFLPKPLNVSAFLQLFAETFNLIGKEGIPQVESTTTSTLLNTDDMYDDEVDGVDIELMRLEAAGNDEFVIWRLQQFVETFNGEVLYEKIGALYNVKEGEALQRVFHDLKGWAKSVGATSLSNSAIELEQRMLDGEMDNLFKIMSELSFNSLLDQAVEDCRRALKSFPSEE